jgi:hypothetical protein
MTAEDLLALMQRHDMFDNALIFHAYKRYMRDYEIIVECHVGPAPQGTYSYLFKYCVEVHTVTSVSDSAYKVSLDERLIDYETGKDLDGYVWGVNWSDLYPGWTLQSNSGKAAEWSRRIGIEFHEVVIKTNAYTINLIFSDLVVEKLSDHISGSINSTYIPLK